MAWFYLKSYRKLKKTIDLEIAQGGIGRPACHGMQGVLANYSIESGRGYTYLLSDCWEFFIFFASVRPPFFAVSWVAKLPSRFSTGLVELRISLASVNGRWRYSNNVKIPFGIK